MRKFKSLICIKFTNILTINMLEITISRCSNIDCYLATFPHQVFHILYNFKWKIFFCFKIMLANSI